MKTLVNSLSKKATEKNKEELEDVVRGQCGSSHCNGGSDKVIATDGKTVTKAFLLGCSPSSGTRGGVYNNVVSGGKHQNISVSKNDQKFDAVQKKLSSPASGCANLNN